MQTATPPVLDAKQIAHFSRTEIEEMPDAELAKVVKVARLPFLTADDITRLTMLGRDSLVRLGYLAQDFCRTRSRETRWSALSE